MDVINFYIADNYDDENREIFMEALGRI